MDTTVANTILEQLGGLGRLRMMIGARDFSAGDRSVLFRFPNPQRSRGNACTVYLLADDTYRVTFWIVRGNDRSKVHEVEGVYCDQLIEIFERQTGLYLTLGEVRFHG